MASKMKLFKGLRYISHIFDEEKEPDMQIGFPTDVKHVAHIGWDGPSAVDAPSWMKEFKSAPLAPLSGDSKENPEIKWVSEDSKRIQKVATSPEETNPDDLSKASRRHSSRERKTDELQSKKDPSTKPRQPRRHHSKESPGGQPPPESLPDIPRRSRRKKSKESDSSGGGSTRCRSRSSSKASSINGTAHASPCPDPGPDSGPMSPPPGDQIPSVGDEITSESRETPKE